MNLFAQAETSDWLQRLGGVLEQIFGGDKPHPDLAFYQIAARAIIVYLIGLIIVRIGKSRIVARITAIDIINAFILGSLLSRGITGSASISGTSVATAAIVACHWLLTALSCRWHCVWNTVERAVHSPSGEGWADAARQPAEIAYFRARFNGGTPIARRRRSRPSRPCLQGAEWRNQRHHQKAANDRRPGARRRADDPHRTALSDSKAGKRTRSLSTH